MGWFARLTRLGRRTLQVDSLHAADVPRAKRDCRLEPLEERQYLAGDLHVGSVYLEDDLGDDRGGDTIQVTFEGGAPGTTLNHLAIDGDKDGKGLSSGDVFFDTAPGGLGTYGSFPLTIVSHEGFTVLDYRVTDGGSRVEFDLAGWDAGEKLVFDVDVDEAQFVDGDAIDVNAIVEGAEFQRSKLTASFTAPHFYDVTGTALHWDEYDDTFATLDAQAGNHLNLPPDRYHATEDLTNRTAGGAVVLAQVPLPIQLSGTVYEDFDGNNRQEADDLGIGQVAVGLELWNGEAFVQVASTQTDASGHYRFEGLTPGRYRIVETQPAGYASVGATPGTVAGQTRGSVLSADVLTDIQLLGGDDSTGNDFAEFRPGSISGLVHADLDGDCEFDPGEPPLAGVPIELFDRDGNLVASTTTDQNGRYEFADLAPGTYTVFEHQPAGYFDGDEHVGTAGGELVANDRVGAIPIRSGTRGEHYDFCELPPASIAGRVHVDADGNCEFDEGELPLSGVTVYLLDAAGNVIGTTQTDENGYYAFRDLAPGTYGVREVTPEGYLDFDEHPGSAGGVLSANDEITQIVLAAGVDAVDYDFCEILPVSLCGWVYHDANDNGVFDDGETGIAGARLVLRDASGNPTGHSATTAADGSYCFTELPPGDYQVVEEQPAGYFDGLDSAGFPGGTAHNPGDEITDIHLPPGVHGEEYNFGELLPASIRGRVHVDLDGNCEYDAGEPLLAGVTVRLRDAGGNVVATTQTNEQGQFEFAGLRPGVYAVEEVQPADYFDGGEDAGSAGGVVVQDDLIEQIALGSGVVAVDYHFCELPPAELSGYVFQDGPPILAIDPDAVDVASVRDGVRTPDDTPLPGVTLELRNGVTGEAVYGSIALAGKYAADQPIRATTDAAGHYQFRWLPAGNYAVYEIHPAGFIDGIDTPGSSGGVAVNAHQMTPELELLIEQLAEPPRDDAILRIALFAGDNSTDNNFSEVRTETLAFFDKREIPAAPLEPPVFYPHAEELPALRAGLFPEAPPPYHSGSSPVLWYTWHLSVVNAGEPRRSDADESFMRLVGSGQQIDAATWRALRLDEGEFLLGNSAPERRGEVRKLQFGLRGALPVAGDFNGDGVFEIGLFRNGQWLIDLNGNGAWDEGDLWAKLGHADDRPVTGDWDGDGKTDIGIFGPAWAGDPRAVQREPGLPDPHNAPAARHKNVPPEQHEAAKGVRTLKRTSDGKLRADLIDHVFFYGTAVDRPLVGDWNGDGTRTIAVFHDGLWHLDLDGDGQFTDRDQTCRFGQAGDIPVVGDFNGDGIDEIGVFRGGKWIIDTNNNGQFDPDDLVLNLGSQGDLPVVGDWDGDGRQDPGVYREFPAPVRSAARP